jgi:hypothetical protein
MPRIDKSECEKLHTWQPDDYVSWHGWAEDKSKTHKQKKCPECGRLAIWIPKLKHKLFVNGETPPVSIITETVNEELNVSQVKGESDE